MFSVSRNSPVSKEGALVVALGNFDGFHIGHAAVVEEVVQLSKTLEASPAVVSFYPHPRKVLGYENEILNLSTLHLDCAFLEEVGIKRYILLHFTKELSQLSARTFIQDVLITRLRIKGLVLGPDARIGKDREGTPEFIEQVCAESTAGVRVVRVKAQNAESAKISSRHIRALVSEGHLDAAARFLGRPYALSGRVSGGDRRGRQLGFPTANINIQSQVLPPHGVYFGRVILSGISYKSVCNIGVRPTFDGDSVQIEAHLLGYSGPEFYKSRVTFSFGRKIREEIRFASKDELVKQIERDIESAEKQ